MKKLNLFLLIFIFLIALPFPGCAQSEHKVLVIYSYHPEYAWQIEEARGVTEVITGKNLNIQNFYMDTKRQTSTEWWNKISVDMVNTVNEFKPDVVIMFDDNACKMVSENFPSSNIPFVFGGMNNNPEVYGFSSTNVTGVIERHHIEETIAILKKLKPGVKNLALITDDSATSQAFITGLTNKPFNIIYITNKYSDWKTKLKELQSSVDAIGLFQYHILKDDSGQNISPEEVLDWTLKNNTLPDFTFFDFIVAGGVLCGVTESGYEQGKAAAEIAVRILNGEKVANIAIQCPQKGITYINEAKAQKLGIQIPSDILKEAQLK
ncbi:MAG: hypothetical protein NTV30_01950 [Chloroflexi bacterium]|nr:hypothetical protein [Chloroflexota bacterium]